MQVEKRMIHPMSDLLAVLLAVSNLSNPHAPMYALAVPHDVQYVDKFTWLYVPVSDA
jgi:hypothetical protein